MNFLVSKFFRCLVGTASVSGRMLMLFVKTVCPEICRFNSALIVCLRTHTHGSINEISARLQSIECVYFILPFCLSLLSGISCSVRCRSPFSEYNCVSVESSRVWADSYRFLLFFFSSFASFSFTAMSCRSGLILERINRFKLH